MGKPENLNTQTNGQNTAWFILQRPVCLILIGLTIFALLIPFLRRRSKRDMIASREADVQWKILS